jgi:hypothetical protein
MSTLNMNIIKIRRYLESVPTLKDELQQDRIYTDIIENTVKGLVSRGSGTENDRTKIDIDFVGALMAVPSAERLFHSHGIVMDEFHFYRKGSSQIARREFDLTDSRFPLPLALRRCTFTETLDLRRARLASLDLTGSILPALMLQGASTAVSSWTRPISPLEKRKVAFP